MKRLCIAFGIMFAAPSLPLVAQTIYPDAGLNNHAQPQRTQVAANLGGGFIEMLMTGNEPNRGVQAQPQTNYYHPAQPVNTPRRRVDLSTDYAIEEPSLSRSGRPLPDRAGAHGSRYPHETRRQQASYAPVDMSDVPDTYQRQIVSYDGGQGAGTIVIDTPNKFLYLVQGNGKAMRYGIGVGRPGFEWAGVKTVSRKAEWPGWTPPPEMLKRRPDLPRHMEGGADNPLGARAMYLGSTMYRIHGTNEPGTIGQAVSSGCIRMVNKDVIDLYDRVRVGTKVIVR
jgi:lipoprotein-anchoring transpeptidase ErfK/SrfK